MRVASLLAALLVVPLSGCFGFSHHVVPADYLQSGYSRWHVEVDYASDQRPDDALLQFIHDKVAPLVNKPQGMTIQTNEMLTGGATSWEDNQILDYAKAHASFSTGGDQVVTHVLFLGGHSAHDGPAGNVLGITFDYDLIVMFPQTIKDSCVLVSKNPCTDATPILKAATLHEFGHALGLVNRGITMIHPHEDSKHQGHSTNTHSVMYWAVESSDIVALLTNGGIPTDFDLNDREDLHAAGGV